MRPSAGVAVAVAFCLAACADTPGVGWGPVALTLNAEWQVPDDRKTGDGAIALAGGWIINIDEIVLTVAAARLQTASSVDAATTEAFDPADPPAGYSNCHGGHCHAADGRLVDYEDIATAIAGAGSARRLDLMLFGGTTIDALAVGQARQARCAGTCFLGTAAPTFLALDLTGLQIHGRVRDGRTVPRLAGTHAFAARIPLSGLQLDAPLGWPNVQDADAPTWRVKANVALGPELLDTVDWTAATGEPLTPDELDLEDLAVAVADLDVDVEIYGD